MFEARCPQRPFEVRQKTLLAEDRVELLQDNPGSLCRSGPDRLPCRRRTFVVVSAEPSPF